MGDANDRAVRVDRGLGARGVVPATPCSVRAGSAATANTKTSAAAADANGDGVIQWQEYLFCAKELDQVLRERMESEAVVK